MFLEYGGDIARFKYRPFTGCNATEKPDILVLDGQQRLTSIYNAMYCRTPVPTQIVKKEKIDRYYYLDIDLCIASLSDKTIDRTDAVVAILADKIEKSDFGRKIERDLRTRINEYELRLFPLNIVFNRSETAKWRRGYNEYYKSNTDVVEKWDKFETDILDAIFTYNLPVIKLSRNMPKEAVCQVFENVNTGGVSLTVFELMTATFASDDFDLRSDWQNRREKMTAKNKLLSVVSDVDFLVAATLLSRYYIFKSDGAATSCKRQDVLNLDLTNYKKYANDLQEGFIQAAGFLVEQRIFSERDLPYTTQFIPLSVLFAVLKQRAQDITVREKLSQWYWSGVLARCTAQPTKHATQMMSQVLWIGWTEKANPTQPLGRISNPLGCLLSKPATAPPTKE
jgi:hypothetical protein